MSKLCQGPSCHMYDTQDRKRGPKGNKRNITRNVGTYNYGNGNFCTLGCQDDWSKEYMTRAVDYFGRLTQPKVVGPLFKKGDKGVLIYSSLGLGLVPLLQRALARCTLLVRCLVCRCHRCIVVLLLVVLHWYIHCDSSK